VTVAAIVLLLVAGALLAASTPLVRHRPALLRVRFTASGRHPTPR
jgi:hypothetical protein